ncbi:hypothetical protein TNCV_3333701 [Trichonephila clavipes]|nr:hypothetical protein TNCV_3333701 [Trichonephila clavipes]
MATDHVILNHGHVTWTTPKLAAPSPNYHTNGRTFQLLTDLTCIAALHGGYSRAFGDGPRNHGQVTWTTPELAPTSPNHHSTATGGRFSSRQI